MLGLGLAVSACSSAPRRDLHVPPAPSASGSPSALSAPDGSELVSLELSASYLVDESWSVSLTLDAKGCFQHEDRADDGSGTERVRLCSACLAPADVEAVFEAARGARLVPEDSAHPGAIRAPRGVGGQFGLYALLAVRGDAARVAPADAASATAVVDAIRSAFEAADAAIEAAGESACRAGTAR